MCRSELRRRRDEERDAVDSGGQGFSVAIYFAARGTRFSISSIAEFLFTNHEKADCLEVADIPCF
jgi:hypothetical protein